MHMKWEMIRPEYLYGMLFMGIYGKIISFRLSQTRRNEQTKVKEIEQASKRKKYIIHKLQSVALYLNMNNLSSREKIPAKWLIIEWWELMKIKSLRDDIFETYEVLKWTLTHYFVVIEFYSEELDRNIEWCGMYILSDGSWHVLVA